MTEPTKVPEEVLSDDWLREQLSDGPRSTRELGLSPGGKEMLEPFVRRGVIAFDPDRFPDEYVPGNPLIVRLPGDDRPWSGWRNWNV